MAGDWIAWTHGLAEKPEVLRLGQRFGLDRWHVAGACMGVWEWFDMQSRDGHAPSVTRVVLDARVGIPGFTEGLIAVGWMIDDGENLQLPNFDRWNSQTAKQRLLATKRKQRERTSVAKMSRSQRDREAQKGGSKRDNSVTPSVTKTRPQDSTGELTATPVGTPPPSDQPDSRPAVPDPLAETSKHPPPDPPPKPVAKPKAKTDAWVENQIGHLMVIIPGCPSHLGYSLLHGLPKKAGITRAIVEQVIAELLERGQFIEQKDAWAVFTKRCKDAVNRPPVGGGRYANTAHFNTFREDLT